MFIIEITGYELVNYDFFINTESMKNLDRSFNARTNATLTLQLHVRGTNPTTLHVHKL